MDDAEQLLEALRAENDELRVRISELEAGLNEYRRQMASVLTSASWRVSAPLRGVAGKVRLTRKRAKQLPRKVLQRSPGRATSTVGLFPPGATSLEWVDSPLLTAPLELVSRDVREPVERPVRRNRVLVVAHVFYPEVWHDIESRLSRMPEPFDLVVTLVRGRAESLEQHIQRRLPHAQVLLVDNHGRDMGPLVELANRGMFDGYDAVLKVHTKRSVHRVDGDAWRVQLLDGVLESPEAVRRILKLLREDRDLGIVAPPDALRGPETWGSDLELVTALAARFPFSFDPDDLLYPSGSMYWIKPWVLQRLADLQLTTNHFAPEADHLDGSTAHALERFIGVLAAAGGHDQIESPDVPSRTQKIRRREVVRSRVLAFYLPQYHQIPENDAWWGDGFTDWVNVAKAEPLYTGHLQPVVAGELGEYDLSDPEVLRAQAALARQHGIDGFVMHHYWFDGQKLLDTPLRNLLADPSIELPFALSWANESWTRSWDGLDEEVLLEQTYSDGWDDAFYDDLLPALRDPRYLRVDGKPLLVVYRVGQVPSAAKAINRWKQRAKADGLGGLHVLGVTPSRDFEGLGAPAAAALDGLVRFPPGSGIGLQSVASLAPGLPADASGDVYSYDAAIDRADLSTQGPHGLRIHPGVMPGWDNTPRRGEAAYVFHGGNPVSFRRWMSRALDAAHKGGPDPLVFVNAWNEWAEGAHLEPDVRFGRGNLEAVADTRLAR
ncbi:MAG: glycosyl transferase family 2 [Frankiales bacterium]|nr:glycosyl transferase family 2 [Frankiales bacterium]